VNKRQRIAQVVLNILIIAELCISILLAGKEPELFTIVFFKYFFMMLIPTLVLGIFVIKILRTKETQPEIPAHSTEKERVKKEKAKESAAATWQKKTPAVSHEIPMMLTREHSKLARISKWRSFFQKTAALCLFIVALSLLDSCQAKFRTPLNVFNVLPGATLEITGPLEKKVPIEELTYRSTSDLIRLSFSEVRTGIWFGGAMWIGRLTVSPDIIPGEYRLMVTPEGYKPEPEKPAPVVLIKVYQDHLSIRQGFKSFIQRSSGIPPWWIVVFCLPFIGLSFGTVFYLSRKIEHLLAQEGKAEVYRVSAGVEGYEIAFGLGTRHGVQPGDKLTLLNEAGRYTGSIVVQNASEGDSVAIAGFDSGVRNGYIVSINKY